MTANRRAIEAEIDRDTDEPPFFRTLVAEVFGTFVLVLVDAGGAVIEHFGSGEVTPVGRSLATGLTIMALIYSLGSASGAHLNPAVTTAFALRGVFPWRRVPGYWAAQLAGACVAAGLVLALFGNVAHLGATEPGYGALTAVVMEIVLTLMLVTVILSTAARHKIVGANAALGVGGIIAVCGLFSRPISGASMNPARSVGPALVGGEVVSLWIYIVGPFVGASLAVLLVWLLHGHQRREEEKVAKGE
jgi:aquaporin Z